jgi:cytochrome c oxidase subunit 4
MRIVAMPERTVSPVQYLVVFAALLLLTFVTLIAAAAPLGRWHTPVALGIAACKALLVILFFMHVLHGGRLTALVIVGALGWLTILLVLTMTDYVTRPWLT